MSNHLSPLSDDVDLMSLTSETLMKVIDQSRLKHDLEKSPFQSKLQMCAEIKLKTKSKRVLSKASHTKLATCFLFMSLRRFSYFLPLLCFYFFLPMEVELRLAAVAVFSPPEAQHEANYYLTIHPHLIVLMLRMLLAKFK